MLRNTTQCQNDPNGDILEQRIQEQIKYTVGQEVEAFYISLACTNETVEANTAGVEEAKANAKRAQGDSVIHNLAPSNYLTRQLMTCIGQD